MALFKQMGVICEDSLVQGEMNNVLNLKLGTTAVDYPSDTWANNVATLGDPLPIKSASGNIAHFTDGADTVPLDTGLFYFNPVQASGTPTPSSPLPITGHTGFNITKAGANIWGGQGMAETFSNCNGYSLDTTNKIVKFKRSSGGVLSIPKTKPNTQYTWFLTYSSTENNNSVYLAYSDGTTPTFSMPSTSGTKTTIVVTSTASKTLIGYGVKWQSEVGEISLYYDESGFIEGALTSSDFEAYKGTTYPVSWTSKGTVYGGYYNSKTGELWKTSESVTLDGTEETWGSSSSYNFRVQISNMKNGDTLDGLAEWLKTWKTSAETNPSVRFGANTTYLYFYNIIGNIAGITGLTNWKTYLANNPLKVVYPLATPVLVGIIDPTEITTYEGVNNIWNDGGGVSEVGYRAKQNITPTVTKTAIADDSSLTGTLDFDGADYHDYPLIECELYNDSTSKTSKVIVTPKCLDDAFQYISNGVCFNEFANNQYSYYTEDSSGNWVRGNNRNLWVKKVYGIVGANCDITTKNFYALGSATPKSQAITTADDLTTFDYLVCSCLTGSDNVPCFYLIDTKNIRGDFNDYVRPSHTANTYNSSQEITITTNGISAYYWFTVDGIKFE